MQFKAEYKILLTIDLYMSNSEVFETNDRYLSERFRKHSKESEWFIDISNDRRFQYFGLISPYIR